MTAPATLSARSGDGTVKPIVQAGAGLPATGKIVFSTSKPGQSHIAVELLEDDEALVATARFELPRGLPANCWIPIEVTVGADLRVSAEARENLRRIRVDAEMDAGERTASHYWVS